MTTHLNALVFVYDVTTFPLKNEISYCYYHLMFFKYFNMLQIKYILSSIW